MSRHALIETARPPSCLDDASVVPWVVDWVDSDEYGRPDADPVGRAAAGAAVAEQHTCLAGQHTCLAEQHTCLAEQHTCLAEQHTCLAVLTGAAEQHTCLAVLTGAAEQHTCLAVLTGAAEQHTCLAVLTGAADCGCVSVASYDPPRGPGVMKIAIDADGSCADDPPTIDRRSPRDSVSAGSLRAGASTPVDSPVSNTLSAGDDAGDISVFLALVPRDYVRPHHTPLTKTTPAAVAGSAGKSGPARRCRFVRPTGGECGRTAERLSRYCLHHTRYLVGVRGDPQCVHPGAGDEACAAPAVARSARYCAWHLMTLDDAMRNFVLSLAARAADRKLALADPCADSCPPSPRERRRRSRREVRRDASPATAPIGLRDVRDAPSAASDDARDRPRKRQRKCVWLPAQTDCSSTAWSVTTTS